MSQIPPGIHRIKLPLPGTAVGSSNAYLVEDGRKGHLLIDTGWNLPGVRRKFMGWFGGANPHLQEVGTLFLTHSHMDHSGLAGEVKEASGCRVCAHIREAALMHKRSKRPPNGLGSIHAYLAQNGVPGGEAAEYLTPSEKVAQKKFTPLVPDVMLDRGDSLRAGDYCFQVIPTPGHSPGHLCLYDPDKRLLICGDQVLPGLKPNVGHYPGTGFNPLGKYLSSLDIIGELKAELVLPGHQEPFSDLAGVIQMTKKRVAQRERALLEALEGDPATAFGLAARLPWRQDQGGLGWRELSPSNRRLALQEIVAHLARLRALGRSAAHRENGLIYHRLTQKGRTGGK